jgi:hypothetical protein
MLRTGGLQVCTADRDQVLIATLIQPDGDVMVSVRADLLEPGQAFDRAALAQRHAKAVQTAMAPLQNLAGTAQAVEALTLQIGRLTQYSAFAAAPFSGGAWLLGYSTAVELGWSVATPFVLPLGAAVLRPTVGWFIRRQMAKMKAL